MGTDYDLWNCWRFVCCIFSFGNLAFNGKSSESMIDMVVSGKSKFDNADAFLVEAIKYIDEKIYPGEGIKEDLATRISKILANNQSLLIDTEEDDTYGEESFNNFD